MEDCDAAAAAVPSAAADSAAHSIPSAKRKRGSEDGQQTYDHIHPRTSFSAAEEIGVLRARIAALESTSSEQAATIASLTATVASQADTIAAMIRSKRAAQELFTDGLHIIFSFLPLIDFASVPAVCSRWTTAANSQPVRGEELTLRNELRSGDWYRSRLWHHVTEVICKSQLKKRGLVALAEGIRTSRSLRRLTLQNIRMDDKSAIALAEAIKSSRTITSLSLHSNLLNDAGESALAAAQIHILQQHFMQHIADIHSQDEARQIQGVTAVRKMLGAEHDPPIQQVLDAGVVSRLIEFLQQSQSPPLQLESAWAITNMTYGTSDHIQSVVDAGAIPVLVALLSRSKADDVKAQVACALGNIADDSAENRDIVLAAGPLQSLLALSSRNVGVGANIDLLRHACFLLKTLCRDKSESDFAILQPALPVLARNIWVPRHKDILVDACWALSYLAEGDVTPGKQHTQAMIEAGVVSPLVEALLRKNAEAQLAALRAIGSICAGTDVHVATVTHDRGVCDSLRALLDHKHTSIRREACLVIASITSRSADQIELVLHADIFSLLVAVLRRDEFDVRREAANAISNAARHGTEAQIRHLVDCGAVISLCALFTCPDPTTIMVAMRGVGHMLRVAQVKEHGLNRLKAMCHHADEDIASKATHILETYIDHLPQ